ncbi:hypothetical protein Btru_057638 [Bulinus truncatus]|nr:hypothetical protein Btru_057638 [Bulinus truncatus]
MSDVAQLHFVEEGARELARREEHRSGSFENNMSDSVGFTALVRAATNQNIATWEPANYCWTLKTGVRRLLSDQKEMDTHLIMDHKTLKLDSDGNDVTDRLMQVIQNASEHVRLRHPDFIGVKVIITGLRSAPSQTLVVNRTLELMRKFPDLVKGFDLVNQEDVTHKTVEYVDELMKNDQSVLPYFFHAGETDWTQWVDLNLVDSVLLNATRIGHGFAAYHHPKVMEAVMTKGIAIELNPISNQVLGLVNDLRNHPGAYLIANGAPVVVSSDGSPIWFATPLSHDFYMAFMALGSADDDLRLLKQLAMNSITYSSMTETEKSEARTKWQTRWDAFIDDVIAKYKLSPDDVIIG